MVDLTMPKKTISISAPRFELYELVHIRWNGLLHPTKILQRWFNPDEGTDGFLSYEVSGDGKFYPEGRAIFFGGDGQGNFKLFLVLALVRSVPNQSRNTIAGTCCVSLH